MAAARLVWALAVGSLCTWPIAVAAAGFVKHADLRAAANAWASNPSAAKNQHGTINAWDVSEVKNLWGLFKGKRSFDSAISAWDVSRVVTMQATFHGAKNFNKDLSKWQARITPSLCRHRAAVAAPARPSARDTAPARPARRTACSAG